MRRANISFKILFWLIIVAIYIAAVLPGEYAPQIGNLNDKAHHILAFVVLGILLRFAYRVSYWQGLLWLLAFGVLIEVTQMFVPNRSSSLLDVAADLIGIFIGLKLFRYISRLLS